MLRISQGKQEYIEYFEDSPASGRLKFEPNAEIGQKGAFRKGLGYSAGGNSSAERKEDMKDIDPDKVFK